MMTKSTDNKIWLLPLIVIVLCVLSFLAGTAFEKGHVKSSSTTAANGGFSAAGGRSGRFRGQRPNIGDVTAVSSTSITIQDSLDGSSKTFSITASTTVTNNGQAAAASDIQTGERVLVRTSGATSATATTIDINPSFGGGGQGGSSSSTGGSSVTD